MSARAARPALTRARAYRTLVPVVLALVGLGTIVVLVLAAGVLLGLLPYPGR